MRGRRARYRKLALMQLGVGLVLMVFGATQIAIVVSLMLAIIFSAVSLRVRDH